MTLNTKSKRAYILIAVLSFIFILFSENIIYSFYLLSSIFLILIVFHYILNYFDNQDSKTLLVLTAFIFLLFGSIHFMFSVDHALFYIIGHFLELIAYVLTLINLLLVLKNDKKKKQA
jgi:hypothetical protein